MATLDYLYVLDAHPAAGLGAPRARVPDGGGGSAGRGAIAASRLGGETRLLAACGTGVHAQVLRDHVEAEGIECTWVAYDQTSQHSAVIVARDHATRTIIWLPQPMADARMVARLPEFLEGVDVALLDTTDGVLAAAALDDCEGRGITSVVDTGSGRPWTASLLGRADHVIAPEKYVMKATGHPRNARRRVVGRLVPRRVRRDPGVARRGLHHGQGARVPGAVGGRARRRRGFQRRRRHLPRRLRLGPGRGLPLRECFDMAAWSAALKVTRLGNAGIPTAPAAGGRARASRPGERASDPCRDRLAPWLSRNATLHRRRRHRRGAVRRRRVCSSASAAAGPRSAGCSW